MLSLDPSMFCQNVSASVLDRLYDLFRHMADSLSAETLVFDETRLSLEGPMKSATSDRFVGVVSKPFSALLIAHSQRADLLAETAPTVHDSFDIQLTFDPQQIRDFVAQLAQQHPSSPSFQDLLAYAQALPPGNEPESQSQFTLMLIQSLTAKDDHLLSLRPSSSLLNQSIIERTQELKDAMLAAEAASRAKSEFLSAMSHELRTPLTYIIGMSATLMRWSFDAGNSVSRQQQQSYLQNIHDRGEHLLDLINNILDLSQLESGAAVLNLQEFSLSRLAQQCLKDCELGAAQKDLELRLDVQIAPDCDRFLADPRRVRQIVLNLLNNAIKFTSEKGKVGLSVFADDESATIQVKDSGIGISEQQRSLVFQKFQQLDSSYQRQYGGAGLGLALTKQLVELHGGWIDFDSTPGVGTVFNVRLPRRSPTSGHPMAHVHSPMPTDYPKGGIVLIENDEESANFISDMLVAAGYQLVWVLDGSTAIDQIDILQPALIMTAIALPDIDGFDLIQQLRQNPSTKKLKIIALIDAHCPPYQDLTQSGADDILLKPIQPDELLRNVELLIAAAQ